MKNLFYLLIIAVLVACQPISDESKELKLWYDAPAADWMTEGLPMGNAYMGAMVFGQPQEEQIQFTEESLWAGGPRAHEDYNYGNRKDAHLQIPKIRELLEKGEFKKAHRLAYDKVTGQFNKQEDSETMFGDYGAQQTMGDVYIVAKGINEYSDYRRELDLKTATMHVQFKTAKNAYKRKFYASYPKRVLVYELLSDKPESYEFRYETPHKTQLDDFSNNIYTFIGALKDNGLEYGIKFKFDTDGQVSFADGKVTIADATRLVLIQTAATAYKNEYPHYLGNDYDAQLKSTMAAIAGMSEVQIYEEHVADYKSLFNRVDLTLDGPERDSIPTNRRQKEYYAGTFDPNFEALYFQYNRYLMISGSRPGSMPLTLQGKWNNSTNPPWACDYHMNINQQMLYWPAEVANLSECHTPLFDYMETLVEPGKVSAKEHFNADGWIVNTMNNAYGFTAPGWGFPWGFFPGGAAWLCQHAWEHYAFTQDEEYLKQQAYPLMKEAAKFWIDYLIKDEKGYLVSCPSYSPEHGGISTGAAMDHQIAWDILNNCVSAAEVLGIDDDFTQKAKVVRDNICPPMIGKWGQLQEWKEDVDDPENKHRHVSHLFALFPGNQISVLKTPELAEAAKVSLIARGDGGTGWSRAWKIAFWARLRDGDHAYKMLHELLMPTAFQGETMTKGSGTYSNLLCSHPPFQLDGNMGGTAGMAEMLLQSHAGVIELLPALPTAWKNGKISGLKARGGYTVDMEWKDGALVEAKVYASSANAVNVQYQANVQKADFSTMSADANGMKVFTFKNTK
ncbi:MAG: glycoside hydrolase N-terminal domain-containing protein [Carboxylicivirga sp.]|jgi:alpha-L-fucosidase 2|nr:glycoside hydrolase N-terminal domain-containing protein [Carboxylicivirga sp.]